MERHRPAAIIDFEGERRAVRITGHDAHGLVVEPPPPVAEHSKVTILAATSLGEVRHLAARVVWRTAEAMGLLLMPQSFSTNRAA